MMARHVSRSRRGITLTEILIGILILGVGVPSLMTLFLMGLGNTRQATRYSRSGFLAESARAELGTRNLLSKASFLNVYSGQWYNKPFAAVSYDPWVQDTPAYGTSPMSGGAYRGSGSYTLNGVSLPNGFNPGSGLPVAYDPLWRMTTPPPVPLGANPKVGYFLGAPSEARFASGLGFVRPDPNPANAATGDASAHGLQRLTNFPYVDVFPYVNVATVNSIFVSPEDMVLQSDSEADKPVGSSSPIVPDLNLVPLKDTPNGVPIIQNDWKYTWMFTGQQMDCTNGTVFIGDIVIFENRPFAVDDATAPYGNTTVKTVAGEPVVEAIFGYTNNITPAGNAVGYGSKANRAVLLRWPASMPDPEVKVGRWIADVTYERNAYEDRQRAFTDPNTNSAGAFYPYQRCYWYQIAKRTEAGPAANKFTGDETGGMREMTVWTSTPLQAFTLLSEGGAPYHVNAALVSPYVVNVFQRTIQTR